MIIVLISCKNKKEAEKIGLFLLKKRLVACVSIKPELFTAYWWPPKKGKIERARGVILWAETIEEKFVRIEKEVKRMHSYQVPAILALPVKKANTDFLCWLKKEIG